MNHLTKCCRPAVWLALVFAGLAQGQQINLALREQPLADIVTGSLYSLRTGKCYTGNLHIIFPLFRSELFASLQHIIPEEQRV